MKPEKDIQKLVEETLGSLDGLQKAEPKPFLFTRVMARLREDENNVWEKMTSFITRPAVVAAMIVLFIFINAVVILQASGNEASPLTDEPVLVAGNDYGLTVSSLYDLNEAQNDLAQK